MRRMRCSLIASAVVALVEFRVSGGVRIDDEEHPKLTKFQASVQGSSKLASAQDNVFGKAHSRKTAAETHAGNATNKKTEVEKGETHAGKDRPSKDDGGAVDVHGESHGKSRNKTKPPQPSKKETAASNDAANEMPGIMRDTACSKNVRKTLADGEQGEHRVGDVFDCKKIVVEDNDCGNQFYTNGHSCVCVLKGKVCDYISSPGDFLFTIESMLGEAPEQAAAPKQAAAPQTTAAPQQAAAPPQTETAKTTAAPPVADSPLAEAEEESLGARQEAQKAKAAADAAVDKARVAEKAAEEAEESVSEAESRVAEKKTPQGPKKEPEQAQEKEEVQENAKQQDKGKADKQVAEQGKVVQKEKEEQKEDDPAKKNSLSKVVIKVSGIPVDKRKKLQEIPEVGKTSKEGQHDAKTEMVKQQGKANLIEKRSGKAKEKDEQDAMQTHAQGKASEESEMEKMEKLHKNFDEIEDDDEQKEPAPAKGGDYDE